MADITNEIQKIGQAVYGEEVRGAIMDALEAMNEQAAAAQEWATGQDDPTAEPGPENNASYYAAQAAAAVAAIPQDYSTMTKKVTSLETLTVANHMDVFRPSNRTAAGLTWTVNADGSITVVGTSTASNERVDYFSQTNSLPSWLVLGKKYHLDYTATNIRFMIYWYRGSSLSSAFVSTYTSKDFTVPDDNTITGMIIRLRVDASGTTVDETVRPIVRDADIKTNKELTSDAAQEHENVAEALETLEAAVETKADADDIETLEEAIGTKADVSDVYRYNSIDALEKAYPNAVNSTRYGITYTKDGQGGWTISGTSTAGTFGNLISSTDVLPPYIVPGRRYYLDFGDGTVPVRIYLYTTAGTTFNTYTESTSIKLPKNLTGIIIRLQLDSGVTLNTHVHYTFITEAIRAENADGGGSSGGNTYNNTYNITTSPVITTDTNGWLQPVDDESTAEADATDMTGPIMSMLSDTGYCHLAPGIYYVSGSIDMPAHSCLRGCGDKTTIRLLQSTTSGYVIRIRDFCTVQDVALSGSASSLSPTEEGTRDGIHFTASSGSTPSVTTNHCMISNVWIRDFSGSGLYCRDTSINYAKGLYVVNAFITRCYKGINIARNSEFSKFVNVCISWCRIACVNNGGNNVFTSCTFHATSIGFYIDGTQPNPAHGMIDSCTFCHIGSNAGSAITLENIPASVGFAITNCQIWYNSIDVAHCYGIVFSGCMFGRGTTGNGANINIDGGTDGGGLVLFEGCVFCNDVSKPPVITVTNNAKARFVGCYGGVSGNEITA